MATATLSNDNSNDGTKKKFIAQNPGNQLLIDTLMELSDAIESNNTSSTTAFARSQTLYTETVLLSKVSSIITNSTPILYGKNRVKGIGKVTARYIDEYHRNKGKLSELERYRNQAAKVNANNKTIKTEPTVIECPIMSADDIKDRVIVNRAPVLSLWVATVAQALGYNHRESYSYAKKITGFLAKSKGKSLGIKTSHEHHHGYGSSDDSNDDGTPKKKRRKVTQDDDDDDDDHPYVQVFQSIKVWYKVDPNTGDRIAIESDGSMVNPTSSENYVKNAFGDKLPAVQQAMTELVQQYMNTYNNNNNDDDNAQEQLRHDAYKLYELFRPDWQGWGAKSILYLSKIGTALTELVSSSKQQSTTSTSIEPLKTTSA